MATSNRPTDAEREAELSKLDLLPKREGAKRADDLLRTLLSSPPDPQIPTKPAKKKRKGE
jgi:hypothetical protein